MRADRDGPCLSRTRAQGSRARARWRYGEQGLQSARSGRRPLDDRGGPAFFVLDEIGRLRQRGPHQLALPARPLVYELSFVNPRGLSGAPLLLSEAGKVLGVVIGNVSMGMEVLKSKEQVQVTDDSGQRLHDETYIRVEALELGVALQTAALLDLRPQLLGGKRVRDHLVENGLLEPPKAPWPDG